MMQPRPDVDLRLAELKQSGAYPVYAITAVREEFGLSLNEAKSRFARSPAWAEEQAAAEVLHQQILDALREDGAD